MVNGQCLFPGANLTANGAFAALLFQYGVIGILRYAVFLFKTVRPTGSFAL
jgi:hypothetical protein